MINKAVEYNQEMIVLLKELADNVTEEKKQQIDDLTRRVRSGSHASCLDSWSLLTKTRP
jgi:hypothetical protein